jgi:aquaporin Z
MTRRIVAEGVGTFVLVFFAVGSAILGIDKIGPVGVALAFGLVLSALAYAIGPISGCDVNPQAWPSGWF